MIEVNTLYLLIFESIGTSELLLIGVVALMFLGPRKMPEMAKKIGKIMADFRNTTSEFKETWEREVNFDDELKSLKPNDLSEASTSRNTARAKVNAAVEMSAPVIKEADPTKFSNQLESITSSDPQRLEVKTIETKSTEFADDLNDKKNWL